VALTQAIPEHLGALPFAASLFVFGMPHGAADGAIAWWWAHARKKPRWHWAGLLAAYTLAIALTILLLVTWPAATLAGFLLIAVLHFGLAAARLYRWDSRVSGVLTAGVIVLFPFATQPVATQEVFSSVASILGQPEFPRIYVQFFAALGIASAGGMLAILVARALSARGLPAGDILWHLALLCLVLLSHVMLPPLMAVGIWFLIWHAAPELLRVARQSRPDSNALGAIVHGHVLSLPLLVPTLLAIAIAVRLGGSPSSLADLARWSIIAYAAVTPGHVVFQETIAVASSTAGFTAASLTPRTGRSPWGRVRGRPPAA